MRVWVTREEPADGPLCAALREHGLTAVLEPVIERCVVAEPAELLRELGPGDWLVLTSPFAIYAADCRAARVPNVAVVGEPSRQLAESLGLRVALVSPEPTGRSLWRTLRQRVSGARVCYPRSSQAPMPEGWPGVRLSAPILYETRERSFDRSVVGRVDVIAVASPSAVKAVGRQELPFASIGPTTTAALRRLGLEPWVEARPPSLPALAKAIAAAAGE